MPGVDGVPDEERRDDRRALPGEPGDDRAGDRPAEPARDRPEIAPARVHEAIIRLVSNTPIEERFAAPAVMGVINVTPDSFSDGGVHFNVEPAVTTAWGMLEAGAAIVDVGGESTRPGSSGVSADEELRRVEPVLADLARRAGVDRHVEGGGRAARARARGRARERRDRAARRPGARGSGRRCRVLPLPHAHAWRAADDAGGSGL